MSVSDAYRIIIDDFRMTLQTVMSLTDNSRGIIYDQNIFIVQAAAVSHDVCSFGKN